MNTDGYVVRVNPGVSTLGSLNPDLESIGLRKRINIKATNVVRAKSGATLRLLFGPMSRRSNYARAQLATRMLFGIMMILNGFIIGSEPLQAFSLLSLFSIGIGTMLICGLFTRISMLASTIVFASLAVSGIITGITPGWEITIAILSFTFALIGPGYYSADSRLRHNIFRYLKANEIKRQIELRGSYRAYQFLDSF